MRSLSEYIADWQRNQCNQTYGDVLNSEKNEMTVESLNLSSAEAKAYEEIKQSDMNRLRNF